MINQIANNKIKKKKIMKIIVKNMGTWKGYIILFLQKIYGLIYILQLLMIQFLTHLYQHI